jgi:hypothetical protein
MATSKERRKTVTVYMRRENSGIVFEGVDYIGQVECSPAFAFQLVKVRKVATYEAPKWATAKKINNSK